ncbi:GNAT family N-acetyltransferase [Bhargavaea beijingensis]|uniref:Acetyltransferase (GNAT) family protein n=1 Tax=Bhargavaea beijingensis TaxID=426756 RepID=A0A1G7DRI5_9BACL|nr:N-acetyltransferase [Bhargavaea beijingensis]MCW1928953.1 GNAT family N-acetyltransferase [Bhargavaea beijingensis]RSK30029.1 N-acetyltransferase [Bhargavaea beijingensis]SDE53455.1 Acetyltransferase (GNAT) family protein [Bhargavaea beijingensis]
MGIRVRPASDEGEAAKFVAALNIHRTNHIGFCGTDEKEIRHALEHGFSDSGFEQSFFVAENEGRIVGAVGFDIDSDEGAAEVWGPFVSEDLPFKKVAMSMWSETIAALEGVRTFRFFVNEENTDVSSMVESIGAIHTGRHLILRVQAGAVNPGNSQAIPAEEPHEKEFRAMHARAFPGTYLSADEILELLDDNHRLFVIPDGEAGVKGYVYTEADPIHGEGSIGFLAVGEAYRRQGLATALLQAGLGELFRHEPIREVRLTVGEENGAAVGLYEAAGFERIHRMNAYRLDLD